MLRITFFALFLFFIVGLTIGFCQWKAIITEKINYNEVFKKEYFKSEDTSLIFKYFFTKKNDKFLYNYSLKYSSFYEVDTFTKKLLFSSFPEIQNITWNESPSKDIGWGFQLHSFKIIKFLMYSFKKSQEIDYLLFSQKLYIDWCKKNIVKDLPSVLAWNDHTTALRLEKLMFLYSFIRYHGNIYPGFERECLNLIYKSCEILSREDFYSKGTNHGLFQSYILFWAGSVFFEFEKSEKWRTIGLERLQFEIENQFTSEAVHKENSPGYHQAIFRQSLQILNIVGNYNPNLSIVNKNFNNDGLQFLTQIYQPNGYIPLIGDTYYVKVKDYLKDFKNDFDSIKYNEFIYAVSHGEIGLMPKQKFAVFPSSGYAVFRNNWMDKEEFEQMVYFILKAGYNSKVHRHDDDLTFCLYGYGEDWIVDAGYYSYLSNDPFRKYCISNLAHNISIIEGISMSRNSGLMNTPQINNSIIDTNYAMVECSHLLNSGYRTFRKVEFYSQINKLSIADNINPLQDTDSVVFKTIFHIPYDKEIEILDNSVRISSKETNKSLLIKCKGKNIRKVNLISGQIEPYIQGWSIPKHNLRQKSYCLEFEYKAIKFETVYELEFVNN